MYATLITFLSFFYSLVNNITDGLPFVPALRIFGIVFSPLGIFTKLGSHIRYYYINKSFIHKPLWTIILKDSTISTTSVQDNKISIVGVHHNTISTIGVQDNKIWTLSVQYNINNEGTR